MKKLYKDQKNTTSEITKKLGLAQDRLYKYIRGEQKIDNMTCKLLYKISKVENTPMETLYLEMKKYLK